jgi:hypothetical protein
MTSSLGNARNGARDHDEAIVSMCMALNAEDPGPNRYRLSRCGVRSQSCAKSPIAAGPWYVMSRVVQSVTPC